MIGQIGHAFKISFSDNIDQAICKYLGVLISCLSEASEDIDNSLSGTNGETFAFSCSPPFHNSSYFIISELNLNQKI